VTPVRSVTSISTRHRVADHAEQSASGSVVGGVERLSKYVEDVTRERELVRDHEFEQRIAAAAANWLD
jgi:hypothetical protein